MSYKLVGLNSLAAASMLYFSVMLLYSGTVSDKYPGFTGTPYTSEEPERSAGRTVSKSLSGEIQPEIGVSVALEDLSATVSSGGVGEKRGASAVGSLSPSPPKKVVLSRVKEEETGVIHSGEHLGQTSEELRKGLDVKNENFQSDGLN